jgi:hypothetical protein
MAGDLKAIWVWRDYLSWPLEGADAFFDDELVDGGVHGAAYPVLNGVGLSLFLSCAKCGDYL